jgi:hypothetical protein
MGFQNTKKLLLNNSYEFRLDKLCHLTLQFLCLKGGTHFRLIKVTPSKCFNKKLYTNHHKKVEGSGRMLLVTSSYFESFKAGYFDLESDHWFCTQRKTYSFISMKILERKIKMLALFPWFPQPQNWTHFEMLWPQASSLHWENAWEYEAYTGVRIENMDWEMCENTKKSPANNIFKEQV